MSGIERCPAFSWRIVPAVFDGGAALPTARAIGFANETIEWYRTTTGGARHVNATRNA